MTSEQRKRLILIIGLFLTVVIIALFYFLTTNYVDSVKNPNKKTIAVPTPSQKPVIKTAKSLEYFPDYSSISQTIERGNEKWFASNTVIKVKGDEVSFYTQKDGIPGDIISDVINHNGTIWVGSHGGAAKFNDKNNRFTPYLEKESNIVFFEDSYTKKMYVSTFKNFYEYNDKTDTFKTVSPGPVNTNKIIFTKDNAFSKVYNQQKQSLLMFDKAKNIWEESNIENLGFGLNSTINLFKVNDRVITYDRSKEYTGCSEKGKVQTVIFFEYKNGNWQKINLLNEKFKDYEPRVVDLDSNNKYSNYADGEISFQYAKNNCSETGGYDYREVKYSFEKDGSITEISEESISNLNYGSNKYNNELDSIAEKTKISPVHTILGIKDGVAYSSISKENSGYTVNGFSQIEANKTKKHTENKLVEDKSWTFNDALAVFCQEEEKVYLMAQEFAEKGGEIGKTKIYELNGDSISEPKDFESKDFGELSLRDYLGCANNSLYFISRNEIKKMDLSDYSISVAKTIDGDNFYYKSGNFENKENTTVIHRSDGKDSYLIFDPKTETLNTVKMDAFLKESNGNFVLYTDSQNVFVKNDKEIIILDKNGEIIKKYSVDGGVNSVIKVKNLFVVSTSSGIYKMNLSKNKLEKIDSSLFPYWGYDNTTSLTLYAYDDSKNNKLWFSGSKGIFSIDYDELGI